MSGFNVDLYIWAEIPEPEHEELRAIVLKNMVHGPCGLANPSSPCMDSVTNTCTKNYPKAPNTTTTIDEQGYAQYRRRCLYSAQVTKGTHQVTVTDRDIVPYNPRLLLRFNCHINVELCAAAHAIRYLFKYVTKGPDRALNAVVEEGQVVDELNDFVNSRYLSTVEADWRICAFNMHDRSPAVSALAIHLEDRDQVVFDPLQPERALRRTSELTRYLTRPVHLQLDNLTFTRYYETIREVKEATENSLPHPDGVHHLIFRGLRSDIVIRIHWVTYQPIGHSEGYVLRSRGHRGSCTTSGCSCSSSLSAPTRMRGPWTGPCTPPTRTLPEPAAWSLTTRSTSRHSRRQLSSYLLKVNFLEFSLLKIMLRPSRAVCHYDCVGRIWVDAHQ